jgi:hypothetical protein
LFAFSRLLFKLARRFSSIPPCQGAFGDAAGIFYCSESTVAICVPPFSLPENKLRSVMAIKKTAPELVASIRTGAVSLTDAKKLAALPAGDARTAAIEDVVGGKDVREAEKVSFSSNSTRSETLLFRL